MEYGNNEFKPLVLSSYGQYDNFNDTRCVLESIDCIETNGFHNELTIKSILVSHSLAVKYYLRIITVTFK